eukprot:GHVQ01002376.1.p1 GENE.GHVQ01002376.1~~GHVQ01002376.1.p1  ORF type:complete len:970 (-),score=166.36 GHVQ01002376.1:1120-3960(-)
MSHPETKTVNGVSSSSPPPPLPSSSPPTTKCVWSFGSACPSPPQDRNLLGGKGKGEVEMVAMGLPVPPGFIVTTDACVYYRNNNHKSPAGMEGEICKAIKVLEKQTCMKFGDADNPLLISVRSGARVSMPGMMETILDLGLNDDVVIGFSKRMGSEKVAYDSYRRFLQMYSNVVHLVDPGRFEEVLSELRRRESVQYDASLSVDALKELCQRFKQIFESCTGVPFPTDPWRQLREAVEAVFRSWDCGKAVAYRRFHGYSDDWGTAVVIMQMVFGNRGEDSATGVGFTRDPSTGSHSFYGEFLLNAQGEDVVAGIRTPHPVNRFQADLHGSNLMSLEEAMPDVYQQLLKCGETLETYFKDMQDVEFTVDHGKLYMLQTRAGKRTGFAAIKIACDMLRENLIDHRTALSLVEPEHVAQLLAPVFGMRDKLKAAGHMVGRGLNAGPGAASGSVALSSDVAVTYKSRGIPCVLVREETSPEDFAGMVASDGILTVRGGATSHAAVVARGMGKSCVCGCTALHIDQIAKTIKVGMQTIKEGDSIAIDGTTGQIFFCKLPTMSSEIVQITVERTKSPEESTTYSDYKLLMDIADTHRTMKVYANVDTPHDAATARAFGAEGVGLCRTEHMFMDRQRLMDVRCMLLSDNDTVREDAVQRLLPYQKADFVGMFRAMDGLKVTIRLLDPPRHEFLPHSDQERHDLAKAMGITTEKLNEITAQIKEANPMLGHRGCRLGITYPYLTAMQTRAILEAAIEVAEEGKYVIPQIMIPLVMCVREIEHQKAVISQTAEDIFKHKGTSISYKVGTMIELPRACLRAEEIGKATDFFSFGTNDLTQCTLGISRDDAGQFLPSYISGVDFPNSGIKEKIQIFETDPFSTLDQEGVGELLRMARARGLKGNPSLEIGVCGEHAGEGRSVRFCHNIGMDYVSCSPYRVAVARLAAGQAALLDKKL